MKRFVRDGQRMPCFGEAEQAEQNQNDSCYDGKCLFRPRPKGQIIQ
jgi:hypothetical protein